MADLQTEQLFAAVGFEKILNGKPTLFKYQLERAAGMSDRIRKRLRAFIDSADFDEASELREFEYRDVLQKVSAGETSDQQRALFAAVPDRELATDMGTMFTGIIGWLNTKIPRSQETTFAGVAVGDPPRMQIFEFRRLWDIACDPETAIADLCDGSLSEDQVSALALLYPAIYADIRQASADEKAAAAARHGEGWSPPPLKMRLLSVLRQEPTSDPKVTAQMQQVYAQDPGQKPPPPTKGKKPSEDDSGEATPGQKASAG